MSAKGSELKRVRQAEKARIRNKAFVSKINTAVKKVLSSTNKKDANEHLNHAIKTIDKVASKNIIHKNTIIFFRFSINYTYLRCK